MGRYNDCLIGWTDSVALYGLSIVVPHAEDSPFGLGQYPDPGFSFRESPLLFHLPNQVSMSSRC